MTTESTASSDDTRDELSVSFPATPVFTRVGRVAVAGLALRLNIEIAMVEKLRMAVDAAVRALHGPGRIKVDAAWRPDHLTIALSNPEATIAARSELANELASLVGGAVVDQHSVKIDVVTRA